MDLSLDLVMVFLGFWTLIILSFKRSDYRKRILSRELKFWGVDILGLGVQGVLVPLGQILIGLFLLDKLLPTYKSQLHISPIIALLLSFTLFDYLYYWNHRLLHTKPIWWLHSVHHTAEQLDIFVTSRNTLWTPLVLVYLWGHALIIFLLKDPTYFLVGTALSAILDLWRHTEIQPKGSGFFYRVLSPLFILPQDHAWHHSRDKSNVNFGANLNIWDRIHGTFYRPAEKPTKLGQKLNLSFSRLMFFPLPNRKEL